MQNSITNPSKQKEPEGIIIIDIDCQTTCPSCGARTEFEEREDGLQLHRCLNLSCLREFTACFDDED